MSLIGSYSLPSFSLVTLEKIVLLLIIYYQVSASLPLKNCSFIKNIYSEINYKSF